MSWHFLPELEAEFSVESSVGSEPCAPLKSTPSVGKCCFDARRMDTYRASLSGMTSALSTGGPGAGSLISLPEVFRVRTSRSQAKGLGSMEQEVDYGSKWPAPLARYNLDTSSWKTAQLSLLGGLESSSVNWPRWGMMQDGECWERTTPGPPTVENGSGYLLPSPSACSYGSNKGGSAGRVGKERLSLETMARRSNWPTPNCMDAIGTRRPESPARAKKKGGCSNLKDVVPEVLSGGQLNPTWVEWLMGWPIGWTDLGPLAMDKFRLWYDSFSKGS